ncbi:MAG: hypothetical protein LUD76_10170 [Alistipes sp.]|nr:hypothetical protein [Alistipes sp.]
MRNYKVITRGPLVFSTGTGEKKTEYTARQGDVLKLPENDRAVKALLARKQIAEATTAKEAAKE